jgi:hypothetical protein
MGDKSPSGGAALNFFKSKIPVKKPLQTTNITETNYKYYMDNLSISVIINLFTLKNFAEGKLIYSVNTKEKVLKLLSYILVGTGSYFDVMKKIKPEIYTNENKEYQFGLILKPEFIEQVAKNFIGNSESIKPYRTASNRKVAELVLSIYNDIKNLQSLNIIKDTINKNKHFKKLLVILKKTNRRNKNIYR